MIVIERSEPVPTIEVADARITSALADPSVREWAKSALRQAHDRDPIDAAADAALVARLLADRADAILAEGAAS